MKKVVATLIRHLKSMDVENIDAWRWAAVGMLLGLIGGVIYTRSCGGQPFGLLRTGGISQYDFEKFLVKKPLDTQPWIVNLTIHPGGPAGYFASFDLLTEQPRGKPPAYRHRQFVPPAGSYPPIHDMGAGTGVAPRAGYSLFDFASDLRKRDPRVAFRYVWWEGRLVQLLLWTGCGALIVGGVWPFMLSVLVMAGAGRRRNGVGADASTLPPAMIAEAVVDEPFVAAPEANLIPTQSEIKPLAEMPLEPVVADAAVEEKEYKGVYYPVARDGHPHKHG